MSFIKGSIKIIPYDFIKELKEKNGIEIIYSDEEEILKSMEPLLKNGKNIFHAIYTMIVSYVNYPILENSERNNDLLYEDYMIFRIEGLLKFMDRIEDQELRKILLDRTVSTLSQIEKGIGFDRITLSDEEYETKTLSDDDTGTNKTIISFEKLYPVSQELESTEITEDLTGKDKFYLLAKLGLFENIDGKITFLESDSQVVPTQNPNRLGILLGLFLDSIKPSTVRKYIEDYQKDKDKFSNSNIKIEEFLKSKKIQFRD